MIVRVQNSDQADNPAQKIDEYAIRQAPEADY
jgi:hypothetical protein